MKSFRVSPRAQADLDEGWDYIARDSPGAADRFVDKLYMKFAGLAASPESGRRRDELMPGLRGLVFRRYLIFNRKLDDLIEVYRIVHGARDVESIFAKDPAG